MKGFTAILSCFVVILCLVQACAALTYEKMEADRAVDALRPNDTVTVTGILKLPPSGDQTFALSDTIEFYTQLEKASWSAGIVINEHESPYNLYGGTPVRKTILGNDLSYPSADIEVKVSFSVSGSIPSTFTSGSIILFRALEIDKDSEQVGAAVIKNGTVFNPSDLQTQVTREEARLVELRGSIDDLAAKGIDVSVAERNYTTAKQALDDATRKITSSPVEVTTLLSTASTRIGGAQVDLKRAWANQALGEAKAMLESVDGLLNEFTVNRSLKATDPRLSPIITKRDLSARSISDATDQFTAGSYDSARTKANDGLGLADEAWNLSVSLKDELDRSFALPGLPDLGPLLPFLGIAAVVLIIAGVVIYRRKTRWDELG
jgi:hypothetical protein